MTGSFDPDPADADRVPLGDPLTSYLSDRDEQCPLCGYNLRNLQTNQCPECGRQLRLTVGLIEPALGAWVATLVALLLPAGVGLLFIVIVTIRSLSRGLPSWSDVLHNPPAVTFMLLHILGAIPLSVLLLARRHVFLQQTDKMQRYCCGAAWTAVPISVICIVHTIGR